MRPLLSWERVGCFALSAAAALAQVPAQAWLLPPGGAAVYATDDSLTFRCDREPRLRPAWPVSRVPFAPFLFQSELAESGDQLRELPHDVRWLGPWLAFDLRGGPAAHPIRLESWVHPFGPLRVTGTASATDADGWQVLQLAVGPWSPPDPSRDLAPLLVELVDFSPVGTLQVRRRYDPGRQVVTALDTELRWQCTPRRSGKGGHTLALDQHWRLAELRANRGAGFEARIGTAIARGAAWLHQRLAQPTLEPAGETDQTDGAGVRALAVMTLLHTGWSRQDTVLRARLLGLRRQELTTTYPLALAMQALDTYYAPPGERDAMLAARQALLPPRSLSAAERDLMQQWTQRLLGNRDRNVDPAYLSRWSYQGNGFDHSNTQYALFGLHAATASGVEVSRGVWQAAARHWLQARAAAEGASHRVQLVTHAEAAVAGPPAVLARSEKPAVARGFGYRDARTDQPYGSMTAAGIAGLTLCAAHLRDGNRQTAELPELEAAIRDAFAWLSRHRTLRVVPADDPRHHDGWWFYWLFSLERACELSQVSWIDGWDWYGDGAELLLAAQLPNGAFGPIPVVDQCFALLFLQRAQVPVFTWER